MWSIFYILAGVGIMLIGVKMLSGGMQQLLGNKLRLYVAKLTKNRFVSAGFTTLSTVAMQSSTATSVMTIGFVGAGILTLCESLPMIIGASVGSSIAHLIVCFNSVSIKLIFSALVFVGAIMYMIKKPTIKKVGMVISGFGLLFSGLTVLGDGVANLTQTINLAQFLNSVNVGVLLIALGTIACIITGSSLGAVAVLISLIMAGAITFYNAVYVLLGINIGTCFTSFFVSFAYNSDSKRCSVFYILFKLLVAVVFGILVPFGFTNLFVNITTNIALNLVLLDIFVNLTMAIILLPATNFFAKLLKKVIKTRKASLENIWSIDEHSFDTPAIALRILNENVHRAFLQLQNNYNVVKCAILESRGKEIVQEEHMAEDFKKITDFIYSDSVRLYSKLGLKEQTQIENLHNQLIGFVKIEDRFLKMIKTLVYGNRMIHISPKQKDAVLKMDQILQEMMEFVNTVFVQIKEDEEFKSEDYASVLIEKVSSITKIKNENKLLIASQVKNSEQENRYTVFLKLMNDYERLGNYMCDIVLNSFDSRCRLVASSQTASENVNLCVSAKSKNTTRQKRKKISERDN